MDNETYEQLSLQKEFVGDKALFFSDGMNVTVESHEGKPLGVSLPHFVTLEIAESEPVVKGQTAGQAVEAVSVQKSDGCFCGRFSFSFDWFVNRHRLVAGQNLLHTTNGSVLTRNWDGGWVNTCILQCLDHCASQSIVRSKYSVDVVVSCG